jgi:hypothetical protein
MRAEAIETDYLVVGAGATAMAFVDTLLGETKARIVLVDRRHKPGGHWNNAYPFVGLHQPAAFYGVASRELSEWKKDEAGLNAGFYSLSTGAAVLDHFDQVMRQRFLPSGRVVFHAMTEYSGESGSHRLTSLTSGETRYVRPHGLVDATHARTEIPSTHPPKYYVEPGVALIPVNGLPNIGRPHSRYSVIGSGKTGIEPACGCCKTEFRRVAFVGSCPGTPGCSTAPILSQGPRILKRPWAPSRSNSKSSPKRHHYPICSIVSKLRICCCGWIRRLNQLVIDAPSFLTRNCAPCGSFQTLSGSAEFERSSGRDSFSIGRKSPPIRIRFTSTARPALSKCLRPSASSKMIRSIFSCFGRASRFSAPR